MIDISDGLLADAGHIATASGVAIDVTAGRSSSRSPSRVGSALGADPIDFILGGGDDHALLATFPEGSVPPAGPSSARWARAPASPSTATSTTSPPAGRTSEEDRHPGGSRFAFVSPGFDAQVRCASRNDGLLNLPR